MLEFGIFSSVSFVIWRDFELGFGFERFTSPGPLKEPRRWVEGACEGKVNSPFSVRVGDFSGLDVVAPTFPVREVGTSVFGGAGGLPFLGLPLRRQAQYI